MTTKIKISIKTGMTSVRQLINFRCYEKKKNSNQERDQVKLIAAFTLTKLTAEFQKDHTNFEIFR